MFRVVTKHGYEITATGYHTFVTPRGRIALSELKAGDTLLLQSMEGGFGTQGSADLGLVLGSLAGDGNFHKQRGVVLSFWGDDASYADDVCAAANRLLAGVESAVVPRAITALSVPTRDRVDLRSVPLARIIESYGVTAETKLRVPEVIWQGRREAVVAYLSALFGADGTVSWAPLKKSCWVRLAQSDREFLQEIQVLLSNFGIESKILLRREAGRRLMPDGRGGSREYPHKAQYELLIDGSSRDTFADRSASSRRASRRGCASSSMARRAARIAPASRRRSSPSRTQAPRRSTTPPSRDAHDHGERPGDRPMWRAAAPAVRILQSRLDQSRPLRDGGTGERRRAPATARAQRGTCQRSTGMRSLRRSRSACASSTT